MCNVYRKFIGGYAITAAALYLGDVPEDLPELTVEQDATYRKLIDAVTNPPVLALPKSGKPDSLDTDAIAHQVGVPSSRNRKTDPVAQSGSGRGPWHTPTGTIPRPSANVSA